MGLPKRRHSHARGAKRRANDFLTAAGMSKCTRCGDTKLPNRVCGNCGFYKEKEIIAFEE